MWIVDILVAVGPTIGYYFQLELIRKNREIGSFSIDICAILLISSILRIFFWVTTGYALNLLFQSIFIITIQLMLLKECVSLSPRPKDEGKQQSFWRWNHLVQYTQFLLYFTVAVAVVTFISKIIWIPFYGTFLGFAALSLEATLGLPQILRNYKAKSVQGLSFKMILTWLGGDFFKTLYFISESQPIQFLLCSTFQLTVDILIIFQIINYKNLDEHIYNLVPQSLKPTNFDIKQQIDQLK